MKSIFATLFILFNLSITLTAQQTLTVGSTVVPVSIQDSNGNEKKIPYLGEKVLTIFYTDPDVKDVNDDLSNAIKARNYSPEKYQGIGIGNCADTWIPDALIRMKARQKEQQFKGSLVLLDTDYILKKAWGLSETNEVGIVLIIGKDRKVKFIHSVRKSEESRAIIKEVLQILDQEIGKN